MDKLAILQRQKHYKRYNIWCLLKSLKTTKLEGILSCVESAEKTEWDDKVKRFYVKKELDERIMRRMLKEFDEKLEKFAKKKLVKYGLACGNVGVFEKWKSKKYTK